MNKKKIIAHISGPITSALIAFVTLPILSSYYSIDVIGKYSFIQLLCNLLFVIFSLGLNQAYVREYFESENRSGLLANMLYVPILLMAFFFLLMLPVNEFIIDWVFGEYNHELGLYLVFSILFYAVNQILLHVFRMEEKIYRYSSMLTLPKFIFVVFSIVMFYIPNGDGLMILARAFLISQIISLFASVYLSRIALRKSVKAGLDLTNLKKMLSFGYPLIFSSLGFWLLTGMDKLFIKELSTYEELGKYAIAANFTAVITIFSTVLLNVYNPKIYQWNANNEGIEKYTSVMYLVSFLCFCIWSLSGVFSWVIPITLPNEINDTEIIFSVLIGGPIMKLLSESTKVGIGISRRSRLAVIPILIAVIFNAILNYLFIPLYGAIGAACSSLISFYILLISRTEISSRCWFYFSRSNYYYSALLFMIISLMSIYFIKIEFGTVWYSLFWLVILAIVVGACFNKCRKCLKVVLG